MNEMLETTLPGARCKEESEDDWKWENGAAMRHQGPAAGPAGRVML